MNGRLWLFHFTKAIDELYEKRPKKADWTVSSWTNFLGEVLDEVASKINCYVVRRRPDNQDESGEYLNIDGLFIDNDAYALVPDGHDPLVLPSVAVELENSYSQDKIAYCLWKIMCIRTPIKVLICYQNNAEDVTRLKDHLKNVILKGNLIKGAEADVIVIIGDESISDENIEWKDYYSVFEWQNDRFASIADLDW
jgi:hypothetical protein